MSNKDKTFPAEAYTTAEVEALMAACSPTSATGKRNRALIATLWRGALRCEEALQLKLHDLDQATGTIRVREGRRPRTVEIDRWGAIEAWLAVRKTFDLPSDAPVFCTLDRQLAGLPVQSRYVRWMLANLGQKAQLGKRVHTEGLRYTRKLELREYEHAEQ